MIYFLVFSIFSGFDLTRPLEGIETCLIFTPANAIYVYVIIYWLVPRFLIKGRYLNFFLLFCAWAFIGLLLNFATRYFLLIPFREGRSTPMVHIVYRDIFALGGFGVMNTIAMFGAFIKFFKLWYIEQHQKMQIEKDKITVELELLRAQLHPHFLFNTLNNLYSLVNEKSDNAPKMLLRLSGLLSYVLYECKADEVLLSKEISVIKDYVALEQERYGERLDVSLNFSGDIEDRMIVPMLFQPFIENAFKHGTSEQLGKVWMSIDLSVKKNQLCFKIINSCDVGNSTNHEGIGIANVKKRLELLYPEKFNMQNSREENMYVVSLVIELKALEKTDHMAVENMLAPGLV
ncbi:MAG TPA: histidine kinase [Puia sp.]|nr:histidine kinase [Puia sp.]